MTTREMAAAICDARAATWAMETDSASFNEITEALEAPKRAENLAWKAYDAAPGSLGIVATWAEASSMLKNGDV